ncbi:hypothetical protein B6D60_12145 [candidate division KSB1 bacterium 4484_87]|nr:MAG: hypothetical protein B6D60_12145 [candidate division KSB1 bacterium 4484_87]
MTRVAMIVFSYYPNDTRVRREAEALAQAGISVDVLCLIYPGEPKNEKINGVNVHRIKIEKKTRPGKAHHIWQYSYFILASFFKLSALHLKKKFDFVHVHNLPDILVLSALVPRIRILKLFEKFSIKLCEHVIVATPFLKETVVKRSAQEDKVTTILNLPDIRYFENFKTEIRKRPDPFNLIYPGTFSKIHGVDIAIHAVKKAIAASQINIHLHLYGLGEEEENLHLLVEKLHLQQHVFFHQMVQIDELAEILTTMDIGLVPKHDGIFIGEAISTKMFDYAAVGLPIICSKTSGDSLYFDETMVQFFEPGNSDQLAESIIKLYHNYELRKKYSENATKLIRKMNWQTVQRELIDIFTI